MTETELLELQKSLEFEMVQTGEKRFFDKMLEATEKGRESTTPAAIALLKGAIEPVSKAIDYEIEHLYDGRAYIHKRLFAKIGETDSKVVAYLSLKALLDSVSRGEALTTMAVKIGKYIEDELRLTSYMEQNRPLMDKVKRNVKKRTSNYKHQKNVLVHTANKAGLEYDNWETDYQVGLGTRLIDIIISSTNLFEIVDRKRPRGRVAKHVVPTKKTVSWLLDKNTYLSILRPLRLPMVVVPKQWVGFHEGGYLDVKSGLIRFNGKYAIQSYLSMSDTKDIQFNQIYDVLNAVQETPWKINNKVQNVMEHFWNTVDEDVLPCLPRKQEMEGPAWVGDDADPETKKQWKIITSKVYSENIRALSHKIAFQKMLWVADKFRDTDKIYFPHNLDFRGRVYPIPDFLNPQGDDASRALLKFAEGKQILTEAGRKHFFYHGANLFGKDKCSDEDKLKWVADNKGLIMDAGLDPISHRDYWKDADKPWQFLAWCIEFYEWNHNPDTFVSHLPIMVDGTCNGLQHLSAIMKDEVGGAAVNLIGDGDTPADIYQMVADKANEILPDSPIKIDRKLCKRPVMTTPYGSTIYGIREQIKDELKKRNDKITVDMEWDNWEDVVKVSDAIYEAISQVIVKSREFMDWLQDLAELTATNNYPLEWVTPFGLYVLQTYHKTKQRRIRTHLNGKLKNYRPSIRQHLYSFQDVMKNRNSISPNFIHSLDAAHLMFTVNDLRYEHDIRNIHVVHDCFGVHADSVELLVSTLKETFIEMYTGDTVVNSFVEDFMKKYLDRIDYFKVVENRPEKGSLNINDVKNSRFFFS